MNIKQGIGAVFMIVQTILGIVLCLGIAIVTNINSDSLMKAIYKSEYLTKTEIAVKETLTNYMDNVKVEEILSHFSVKSQIKELANAIDNNTIDRVADHISNDVKGKIVESIQDDVEDSVKDSYATVVSDAYMKTIFPTTELNIVSNIYTKYANKIELALIVIGLIYAVIYVCLSMGKKTYKWEIISLYNVMILTSIIAILIGSFSGVVIGNERTTSVIINLIKSVQANLVITILAVFVICIISNYIAYFKKSKKRK